MILRILIPYFLQLHKQVKKAPVFGGKDAGELKNAFDIEELKKLDIIVTCQGGDYTNEVYPKLKQQVGTVIGLMPLLHYA